MLRVSPPQRDVARLHHGRDLGEPFDSLAWFEYAPAAAGAFEELLAALCGTEKWRYVEREVDLWLVRRAPARRQAEPALPGGRWGGSGAGSAL